MPSESFRAQLTQRDHFRFDVTFDDESWEPIVVDEAEPLGTGKGPTASRLLAGAVGNCLAASLLLCTDKAHVPLIDLRAEVEGTMIRNETGRLRIGHIDVRLVPTVGGEARGRYDRCVDIFEDFCIVTQSVRAGIDIDVNVEPVFTDDATPEGESEMVEAGG